MAMADEHTEHEQQPEQLAERVLEATLGALDMFSIYVGDRLQYYPLLLEHGPLTSAQLAERAGTIERYTREWLEHQAVTGIVAVTGTDPSGQRRFVLSEGYGAALTDPRHEAYAPGLVRQILAAGYQLRAIADAHRSGGGVPWSQYGEEMRQAQGDMNRPFLENVLARDWLASIPALDQLLSRGAKVADIGTGHGWSAIGIAREYPLVTVDGYDLDEPSVAAAREHAEAQGVADRVRFCVADAADPDLQGNYDLVTTFEVIHDLPDPVSTLATMRRIAAPEGWVVVMDMKVADAFDPDAGDLERLMYGFSNFICLPDGMSHPNTVATGTVMRPDTLRRYAKGAGFSDIEVLPIETDSWRFYRMLR